MGINRRHGKNNNINETIYSEEPLNENTFISIEALKEAFGKSKDVVFKSFCINENTGLSAVLVFIVGLVNLDFISDYILKPLLGNEEFNHIKTEDELILKFRSNTFFPMQQVRDDINGCIDDILSGNTAVVFDSIRTAVTFSTQGFEKRGITEPTDENVLKGSKDSFIEVLRVNTSLVRRKIKSKNLMFEEVVVGKQSRTSASIAYMNNIANKELVEEVKERLLSINIDHALQAGFVEEFIIDHRMTAFPLVVYTERPDRFSANLLMGRVGIIIDGLPMGIIAPGTFLQFLQAPEDYAQNWIVSSLLSVVRYTMFLVALFLPGFYIAVTAFHQEMIPSELAIAISTSKEGVPFPGFIEVFIMLIAFEALLEAGLRLPKAIGQSVSIVGAIVVGQAAVEAKLISPAVIVAIAFTAIASFTMPNQDFSNAIRVWRLLIALASSILGLYGLSICTLFLLHHLCRMESFGVPYLSPFVSCEGKQTIYDTVLRLPLWYHKSRPKELRTINKKRQGD